MNTNKTCKQPFIDIFKTLTSTKIVSIFEIYKYNEVQQMGKINVLHQEMKTLQ